MINQNIILSQKKNINNNIALAFKNQEPIIGEFAGMFKYKSYSIVYRDHLGCKKFFFLYKNKKFYTSNNYIDLIKYGENLIKSSQSGYFIKLSNKGKFIEKTAIPKYIISDNRERNITKYLRHIKNTYGEKCIVCLSGGLDSTIIAHKAKKIFKDVKLITAYFDDEGLIKNDDYKSSEKIGKFLKLKHYFLKIDKKKILKDLDKIMYACQDWRDYNLHCSCLNFSIGKFIKNDKNLKNRVVLTGDFMNEFVADYSSEKLFGKVFYRVPNLPKKTLQKFFTRGLDTSSRESGVFNYFNLRVFQPFNVLKEYYFKFKEKEIKNKNFKYKVNKNLIPKKLYNLVNKKKIRAQIGDEKSAGIIEVFHEKKIYQLELEKIFIEHFKCTVKWLHSFIQFGKFNH